MNPQLLYLEDPTIFEFETEVTELLDLPGGRKGALLSRSYFYPTGGGQEHDNGEIGGRRVLEVYKEGHPERVVHVLEGDLPLGPAKACIDRERRQRHMQHHTAQHLLTQCFLRLFDLETVSAHINGYSPSSLDLPAPSLSKEMLEQAEGLVNEMIWADLPVRSYFVSPEEVEQLPLRKQPAVREHIRIVEIEGFDWTPCGGTHVLTTGALGLLKVVKAERQNEKMRVHFIAGRQALENYRLLHDIVTTLAGEMSLHPRDLPAAVQRQGEALRSAERELNSLRALKLQNEARLLFDQGEHLGGARLVSALFENRPSQELRMLGDELRKLPGAVAALASFDGGKLSVVAACSVDSGLNARELLQALLAPFNGRGGGDPSLAQGGGSATEDQRATFVTAALALMRSLLTS